MKHIGYLKCYSICIARAHTCAIERSAKPILTTHGDLSCDIGMIVRHIRLRIEFVVCECLCYESCMLCALSVEHTATSLRWLFVVLILEVSLVRRY